MLCGDSIITSVSMRQLQVLRPQSTQLQQRFRGPPGPLLLVLWVWGLDDIGVTCPVAQLAFDSVAVGSRILESRVTGALHAESVI